MSKDAPELTIHKEWLGQIQQVGLVVSPHVLVKQNVGIDRQKAWRCRPAPRARTRTTAGSRASTTFLDSPREVLEWPVDLIAGAPGGPELPDTLTVALPEYDDRLAPDYALARPVRHLRLRPRRSSPSSASSRRRRPRQTLGGPEGRLARLAARAPRAAPARDRAWPSASSSTARHLRLVYAPRGESSGHLTFRFKAPAETLGRPMAGALCRAARQRRVTDGAARRRSACPALLHESRKYQNEVSTKLAGQVLEALWELLRGFQRAQRRLEGRAAGRGAREQPDEVYGGLLSTLMRLVFVLYAEDRGLMPAGDVYQRTTRVGPLRAAARGRGALSRHHGPALRRVGAAPRPLPPDPRRRRPRGTCASRAPRPCSSTPTPIPFLEGRPHGGARQSASGSSRPACPTASSSASSRTCSSSTASASPTARSTWSRSARSTRR
jgi:hypothetical protein